MVPAPNARKPPHPVARGLHVASRVNGVRRRVPYVVLVASLTLYGPRSITVGYHRLYSHRAFRAALPVRMFVAVLGASAFQGSIKVSIQRVKSANFDVNAV